VTHPATDPAATSGDLRLTTTRRLTPQQVTAVTALVDEATDVDGVRPLSEHVMLHLRYGGDEQTCNLLAFAGEVLVGYTHLDVTDPVEGPSAELAIHPQARRRGYGRRLTEAALRQTGGQLRLWAHGNLPAAAAMANRLGFRRTRSLWQMRRSLAQPLPRPELPDGITVRAFRPGTDEAPWLALNARIFADHPEQGSWTAADLQRRMQESWFDPDGFFLAERADGGQGDLVGFHWTKVHGARGHDRRPAGEHGHEPIGEVYVVGVDPSAAGTGLGRALTVFGLRHLRAAGLQDVMLYVDESNKPAIRLYESLGFARWSTDVLFRHDPD
jgi:mycothiol synthase